jgi:hypothetical protein
MQYAKLIVVIGLFSGVDQHLALSRADGKRSNFKTPCTLQIARQRAGSRNLVNVTEGREV